MNILWRSGRNPEQSGDYLVLYKNEAGCYHFAEISYSAVHQKWNYFDFMETPKADEDNWDVKFWVPAIEVIPDMILEEGVE